MRADGQQGNMYLLPSREIVSDGNCQITDMPGLESKQNKKGFSK